MNEPKPIAWIGFPESEPKPPYDLVYDNAAQLPGYRYTPIWAPQDHPCAVRDRKGAMVNIPTPIREPDGFAYKYHGYRGDVIHFNGGEPVNGSLPFEAVPYYLGTPQPVGGSPHGWTDEATQVPAEF